MQLRLSVVILLVAGFLVAGMESGAAQTVSGLQVPPADSAEAWRVRMWVPQESTTQCRMEVRIVDDSNRVVRHVIDFLAGPGYYNFYWDKLDDSGRRVPAGEYRYIAEYCGEVHRGTVEARYNRWERISRVEPYDTAAPLKVGLVLEADSVPVTIRMVDYRDVVRLAVVSDTVLDAGRHVFHKEPEILARGNYFMEVHVGDHVYRREVTYLR